MAPRTRSSRPATPSHDTEANNSMRASPNAAPVEITTGVSSATRPAGGEGGLDATPQLRRQREGSRVRPPQDVYDPV